MRAAATRMNEGRWASPGLAALPLRWLLQRPRDSIAAIAAAGATVAILVNALFMQSGPHPAPIFANKPPPAPVVAAAPQLAAKAEAPQPVRARSDTVAAIQRELARRGFYDGLSDGFYGPKTDAAIRDFEQVAGLRPSPEPNELLLAAITRSNVRARPVAAPAPANDPIAALLAPSGRIMAVQRALTDFGYGPVKPTGVYDAPTRASIERFERARKRPVTGQITDHLVRELASLTGRPLE
jgi:peptidoglycan hydrolase-like protein with peptidoglycan-binding domain